MPRVAVAGCVSSRLTNRNGQLRSVLNVNRERGEKSRARIVDTYFSIVICPRDLVVPRFCKKFTIGKRVSPSPVIDLSSDNKRVIVYLKYFEEDCILVDCFSSPSWHISLSARCAISARLLVLDTRDERSLDRKGVKAI